MTLKEERELKKAAKLEAEKQRIEAMREYEEMYDTFSYICGIDEAGRGPLAGPVVIAAAIMPRDSMIEGVNDSKKVSEILMSSASSRTVAGIEKNEDIKRRSQISALKLEIQNLTPAERQFYVQQAISKLIEKGLFTPVIRRRAEQGDQLHGVLGSMVIQCYAEVVYGEKWAEVMGCN